LTARCLDQSTTATPAASGHTSALATLANCSEVAELLIQAVAK